ncbi:unnamed protein product [Candida verbasci]|uniref:Uncharacterized protein n=1 Tax=Candida verbasci TaxID=1227364 RepID=A0A9W4TTZ7_9ASCO|nr:unnamed protein product [Candida verbasci]
MFTKSLKYLIIAFLISTHKSIPIVSYAFRFYYHVITGLLASRFKYNSTKLNSFGFNSPEDLFKWSTLHSRVSPLEVDMYLHKSNSTYFLDLDIARTKLLTRLFQKFWWIYFDNEKGIKGRKKGSISNFPYAPVATVSCHFKRELKPFEKFAISSRILAWDKKWLFVVSKFTTNNGKTINAIALTKYVFKTGRLSIAPIEYITDCNFASLENDKINEKNINLVNHMIDTEDLEKLVEI